MTKCAYSSSQDNEEYQKAWGRTSWMFGDSSSSANTKTPGAEVASSISLAAAAPLADFAISKNLSSLPVAFAPISIVDGM